MNNQSESLILSDGPLQKKKKTVISNTITIFGKRQIMT